MRTDVPELSAAELIYLLRAEAKTAGVPLYIAALKEYLFEEDFDRAAYGLKDKIEFDLVTSIAQLTVEPWVESGYWILDVTIECALGPIRRSKQDKLVRRDLTLDQFEQELLAPGSKQVNIGLEVETPAARNDFARWLAGMRLRHPYRSDPLSDGERHKPSNW